MGFEGSKEMLIFGIIDFKEVFKFFRKVSFFVKVVSDDSVATLILILEVWIVF